MKREPEKAERLHEPYDVECEQALLGSLLLDNRLIDVAAGEIDSSHFYDGLHARLFDTFVYMVTEGEVTPLVLNAVMKSDPDYQEVGGIRYMAGLAQAAPALPNVKEFSRIIRDLAYRRRIIGIAEEMVGMAQSSPLGNSARGIADQATEALLQVGFTEQKATLSPYEIGIERANAMAEVRMGKPVPLLRTGISRLDEEIGGLGAGELTTIMGKSGTGKSALMGCLALNLARQGIPTLVFSLEMTREQWVDRTVCDLEYGRAQKGLWYSKIRNGTLTEDELERFILANRDLDGIPLEIVDEDGLTVSQIASRAMAFAARHAAQRRGVVIADYIQIVDPQNPNAAREQQVAGTARGLKGLSKRLARKHGLWSVVAGSQMNEDDSKRVKEERRPQASDARESRSIMNESDVMLAPWREAMAILNRRPLGKKTGDPEFDTWKVDLSLVEHRLDLLGLKNRNGRRFDIELHCDMASSAIRDEAPYMARAEHERAAADLLGGIG